jgi:hypothetical protein
LRRSRSGRRCTGLRRSRRGRFSGRGVRAGSGRTVNEQRRGWRRLRGRVVAQRCSDGAHGPSCYISGPLFGLAHVARSVEWHEGIIEGVVGRGPPKLVAVSRERSAQTSEENKSAECHANSHVPRHDGMVPGRRDGRAAGERLGFRMGMHMHREEVCVCVRVSVWVCVEYQRVAAKIDNWLVNKFWSYITARQNTTTSTRPRALPKRLDPRAMETPTTTGREHGRLCSGTMCQRKKQSYRRARAARSSSSGFVCAAKQTTSRPPAAAMERHVTDNTRRD